MKAFNVDEFLKERSVEITLNGKKFVVKDIDPSIQKMMREDEPDHRKVVQQILRCNDEDLEGYGVAAFIGIINEVTKNLFQASSQNDQ